MAVINPDHMFEQAERLAAPPAAGPPRQADLRRAISAAYYGLFHFVLTAVADEFVGKTKRAEARYALVYRRLDHSVFKVICIEAQRPTPSPKFAPFVAESGFGANINAFAAFAIDLQEKRHRADYDSTSRLKTSDALLAVAAARSAVRRFERAGAARRKTFLTLLLCPPR